MRTIRGLLMAYEVIHAYPTAVLREENVDITVGRVAVQLSLDVAPKTAMAVT